MARRQRNNTNQDSDAGTIGLLSTDGNPIPLIGLAYQGKLSGLAMELTIRQRYQNTEKNPLETVYTFPVPDGAAVCGVTVTNADRVLKAEIEEREKAFEKYDDALAEGHGAILLDQERANLLHLSVGSILPGKDCVVEVRMVYEAAVEGKGVRILLPTTVSPRYTPVATDAEELAELERITPPYALSVPYGFSLEVEADLGCPIVSVSSPSHALQTAIENGRARVSTACREEPPNRDIVLTFETVDGFKTSALAANFKDRDHVMVTLMPEVPVKTKSESRDIAFVVDCSGSMTGESIDEARRAIELCVRQMTAGDRLHILRFGSQPAVLFKGFKTLSQEVLDEIVLAVRAIEADLGGTEILSALQQLQASCNSSRMLHVILLTDGGVSNEAAVLELAKRNAAKWRFFTFGIGTGVNESFVRGLATVTRGKAEFIAPRERIEPKVLRQFARISAPLVDEVSVDWGLERAEVAPAEYPPIFPADPFVATAAVSGEIAEGHVITVRGKTADGLREWKIPVHRVDSEAVACLWAKKRIADMEERFGAPVVGSRQERKREHRGEALIELSKQYSLLCSKTSFVAIEERTEQEKNHGPLELRRVPVMINDGWHGVRTPGGTMSLKSLKFCCQDVPPPSGIMASISCGFAERLSKPTFVRPKPRTDALPIHLLLMTEQQLDGSFRLTLELSQAASLPLAELKRWAKELGHPNEVIATALVAALLRVRAANSVDEWSLCAEKAMAWLEGQMSEEVAKGLVAELAGRISTPQQGVVHI